MEHLQTVFNGATIFLLIAAFLWIKSIFVK